MDATRRGSMRPSQTEASEVPGQSTDCTAYFDMRKSRLCTFLHEEASRSLGLSRGRRLDLLVGLDRGRLRRRHGNLHASSGQDLPTQAQQVRHKAMSSPSEHQRPKASAACSRRRELGRALRRFRHHSCVRIRYHAHRDTY